LAHKKIKYRRRKNTGRKFKTGRSEWKHFTTGIYWTNRNIRHTKHGSTSSPTRRKEKL